MNRFIFLIGIVFFSIYAQASEKLSAITTQNEFSVFTHTYYLNPNPGLIESALKFVNSSGLANKKKARDPILMSFSCIFSRSDSTQKEKWKNTINNLGDPAKSLLTVAINKTPNELLDSVKISPVKNDMNWACFFATGELRYLNGVISTLRYLDERKDVYLFLTAASAKWSLSSNARGHEKVRIAIKAARAGNNHKLSEIAEDILNKKPEEIRQETILVVKSQKEKGVW